MKVFLFLLVLLIAGAITWYYIYEYKPNQVVAVKTPTPTDTIVIVKESVINARAFDTIPSGFTRACYLAKPVKAFKELSCSPTMNILKWRS